MTDRKQYLPDLHLAGLSIDDLIDLLNWLRPLSDQFDTGSMGAPFTTRYHGREDVFDDTHIGEVVSSIGFWASRQHQRSLTALQLCAPLTADEADYRGAVLMHDSLRNGDWSKSAALFSSLHVEAQKIDADKKTGAK